MASIIRRSSWSLAHSLNHDGTDLERPHKGRGASVMMMGEWENKPQGVSMNTIPPIGSWAWQKLSKFQRRFYGWLVYSHHLAVEYEDTDGYANPRQQPLPQPSIYHSYRHTTGEPDSAINAYDDDEEEEEEEEEEGVEGENQKKFVRHEGSPMGPPATPSPFVEVIDKNAYSPYVGGMDVRLAKFVNQHNVNMDDGAIICTVEDGDDTNHGKKRAFIPPCGCTLKQFSWILGASIVFLLLILAVGLALGLLFGASQPLKFPEAEPWWTHGLVYQIHVPTFANDAGGTLGRLKDVTTRMVYLADRLYATAAILTGVLDTDKNGVRNWKGINQDINSDGGSAETLLGELDISARGNEIELMLGMPLYTTSKRHPWFLQSARADPPEFASYYMWRKEAPVNPIEARYYAYGPIRQMYYRHVHGNPDSPLLNLTDPGVQAELMSVIAFWKEELGISGVFITNSTNLLPEMAAPLTKILSSGLSENTDAFTWFADNPTADKLLTGKPVCYYELISNERITTRTDDISAQLYSILPEIKQRACTPAWRLEQRSADFTDYFSLQKLAAFLPGLSIMKAGEEVQLMTGTTELIQWDKTAPLDYKTYWPVNVLPGETAQSRLAEWERYGWLTVGGTGTIFETGWDTNEVRVTPIPRTENLFVVQRIYRSSREYIATFFVSFQALNAFTNLADVVADPSGAAYVNLIYEGRSHGSQLKLTWVYLINNNVCITLT